MTWTGRPAYKPETTDEAQILRWIRDEPRNAEQLKACEAYIAFETMRVRQDREASGRRVNDVAYDGVDGPRIAFSTPAAPRAITDLEREREHQP